MKAVIGGAFEVEVDARAWMDEFGVDLGKVQSDAAHVVTSQVRQALEEYARRTDLIKVVKVR